MADEKAQEGLKLAAFLVPPAPLAPLRETLSHCRQFSPGAISSPGREGEGGLRRGDDKAGDPDNEFHQQFCGGVCFLLFPFSFLSLAEEDQLLKVFPPPPLSLVGPARQPTIRGEKVANRDEEEGREKCAAAWI